MWKDLFFAAIDTAIPKTKWKKRKMKHWFAPDTIHLIHQKRKLYHIMKQCSQRPGKIPGTKYAHFLKLTLNSSVKGHRTPLLHNEPVIDDHAKAEVFNHYFNSVFTNENMANFNLVNSSVVFYS